MVPWFGSVWCNAPYGRTLLAPWLDKFNQHGNGIAPEDRQPKSR
jgi:hypothetical protein